MAGCTAIAHFVAISLERARTMLNPQWAFRVKAHMPRYIVIMIIACWAYGLFWSILPLVGKFITHRPISSNCDDQRVVFTSQCLRFTGFHAFCSYNISYTTCTVRRCPTAVTPAREKPIGRLTKRSHISNGMAQYNV